MLKVDRFFKETTTEITELVNILTTELYKEEGIHENTIQQVRTLLEHTLFNLFKRETNPNIQEYNYIVVPQNKNHYNKSPYSYRAMQRVQELLKNHNIIRVVKGKKYNRKYYAKCEENSKHKNLATKWYVVDFMQWAIPSMPVNTHEGFLERYMTLFSVQQKDKPVAIHNDKKKLFHNDKKKGYKTHAKQSLKKQVNWINQYNMSLGYPVSYRRIFGKEQHEGGRLFSPFNSMKKEYRQAFMDIFGFVEIDHTAFNINSAYYYKHGVSFQEYEDIKFCPYSTLFMELLYSAYRDYEIAEIPKEVIRSSHIAYRPLLKKIALIMISAKGKNEARQAISSDIIRKTGFCGFLSTSEEKTQTNMFASENLEHKQKKSRKKFTKYIYQKGTLPKGAEFLYLGDLLTVDRLMNIVEEVFSGIDDLIYSGFALISQQIESNILMTISKEMMKDNIPCLFIHDAILVPAEYEQKYSELFKSLLGKEAKKVKDKKRSQGKGEYFILLYYLFSYIFSSLFNHLFSVFSGLLSLLSIYKYKMIFKGNRISGIPPPMQGSPIFMSFY